MFVNYIAWGSSDSGVGGEEVKMEIQILSSILQRILQYITRFLLFKNQPQITEKTSNSNMADLETAKGIELKISLLVHFSVLFDHFLTGNEYFRAPKKDVPWFVKRVETENTRQAGKKTLIILVKCPILKRHVAWLKHFFWTIPSSLEFEIFSIITWEKDFVKKAPEMLKVQKTWLMKNFNQQLFTKFFFS